MTYFDFQWIKLQELLTMGGGKDCLISINFCPKILGGILYQCSL